MESKNLKKLKTIIFTLFLGTIFGIIFGLFVSRKFTLVPFFRKIMPIESMLIVFLSNSFLATLICYGGIFFSLTEIRVYSFSTYKFFDRFFNPFYNFLGKFSEKIKRLKPMYRSCYFSLFYFPLGCVFLFSFLISSFFSIFISILGFSVLYNLVKLFPHIFLETFVFSFSAFQALVISEKIEKYLFDERVEEYKKMAMKLLKDRKTWKKLLACYSILFFSSILEKIFIEI
ncbi:MAG: hypothetical protein NZ942_01480 [Candidatus Aenigmarchaeota archaeon]|nr:hypothetical protein [Candidatus Aenigmarchaeota archaeon]